jgi:hypothetical protein
MEHAPRFMTTSSGAMADPLGISALVKKRAGPDGDLRQTAKRLVVARSSRSGMPTRSRLFADFGC